MYQVACILIPIVIMTLALPIIISNRKLVKYSKLTTWCTFFIYCFGNLYFTLLTRKPGTETYCELIPFRSYAKLFEPFYKGTNYPETFAGAFLYNVTPLASIILNVLLYYPFGYLLPAMFPKLKTWQIIMIGLGASVATEFIQYIFKMGWCETVDIIHNTLGTVIGLWMWKKQAKG